MAQRLIASTDGARLRYVYDWGRWIWWSGTRWVPDSGEAVDAMAAIAREVLLDALERSDTAAVKAALRQEQAGRIAGALELAAADRRMVVRAEALDADTSLLSAPNGVVDLRTGTLRRHDPADLLTRATRVPVDLEGQAPRWTRFLAEVLPDRDVQEWIRRLAGAAILCAAGPREHVVAFATGSGANGKSVLVGALLHALGDYAHTASSRLLLDRGNDDHPTAVADLHGRRLVVVSELPAGGTWHEERLKALSGGDRLTARRMREDFWSFEPTHSLLVVANHEPRARDTSPAFWRRLRVVRFAESFVGREDRGLPAALEAEGPAILGWCVRGAIEYQARGLDAPAAVQTATTAYQAQEDRVRAFLDEQEPGDVRAKDLFASWRAWSEARNEKPGTQTAFGRELGRLDVPKEERRDGNWYVLRGGFAPQKPRAVEGSESDPGSALTCACETVNPDPPQTLHNPPHTTICPVPGCGLPVTGGWCPGHGNVAGVEVVQ